MKDFFAKAAMQKHPLRVLENFLDQETANEKAKKYGYMRFVGYVLDIGYDTVTIITSDPFKIAVGGVPRNSLLIMTPSSYDTLPPHFTLLRVLESAPTPLSKEVQQTYFELQKKSMPELDIFTQSELQWGALKTGVLGMFYPNPEKMDAIEYSGDLNNFVSAHKYRVYAPDDALLNLITNSMVPADNRFPLGDLRLTECRMVLPGKKQPNVTVHVSTRDFMGARTAMFGKTRLGKSNVVKLIAQSLIETTEPSKASFELTDASIQSLKLGGMSSGIIAKLTPKKNKRVDGIADFRQEVLGALSATEQKEHGGTIAGACQVNSVGQLIFDINGEYANDNPQDNSRSLATGYPLRCSVYALSPKPSTPSKPLKLNFYEHPDRSHKVLAELLENEGRTSIYVQAFRGTEIPSLESLVGLPPNERRRTERRILMYWSILKKAGYDVDEPALAHKLNFDPHYNANLRTAIYGATTPPTINSLGALVSEYERAIDFIRANPTNPVLNSTSSGQPLFTPDDLALLNFLKPSTGAGPAMIQRFRIYHDRHAGDFATEILALLDQGQTVILDLGNANPEVMAYFSEELSRAVFNCQVDKFTNNALGTHFVQLYFEEAHNLFPLKEEATIDIYRRLAKEGAKYHIGMVYSTQSVTTINKDLLAQTENFFIAHMSSQDEVNALAKVNVAYESMKDDILQAKTPGYVRILTRSHRFVVSVQARKFTPPGSP